MAKRATNRTDNAGDLTPQEQPKRLIDDALKVAGTARRHNQSLNGVNFYANKMASLRSAATIAFGQLARGSVGDTSALAELMAKVFSVDAQARIGRRRRASCSSH